MSSGRIKIKMLATQKPEEIQHCRRARGKVRYPDRQGPANNPQRSLQLRHNVNQGTNVGSGGGGG